MTAAMEFMRCGLGIYRKHYKASLVGVLAVASLTTPTAQAQTCQKDCRSAFVLCASGDGNKKSCALQFQTCLSRCTADCQGKTPGVPTSLSASTHPAASGTGVGQVTLTWSPPQGIAGDSFVVTRDGDDIASVPFTQTQFTESNLPLFFSYGFQVRSSKTNAGVECGSDFATFQKITPVATPLAPVWGFADTHTHPFANDGFDQGSTIFLGAPLGPKQTAFGGDYVGHGPNAGGPLHPTGGYPSYDGWPSWNVLTHQQMHTDWLYRAFQGGLRLIVALAVNNEALCISGTELGPDLVNLPKLALHIGPSTAELAKKCNDDDAVTRQIADIRGMEAALNSVCTASNAPGPPQCPLPQMGWFHVVTSSSEARETINRGQMAVVLGVEVDRLFNCPLTTIGDSRTFSRDLCTPWDVRDGLDRYQSLGIRHYFIGHLADTPFAGMAIYSTGLISWNLSNHFLNGVWLSPEPCKDPNITFDLNSGAVDTAIGAGISLFSFLGYQGTPPQYRDPLPPSKGHCNAMGLTDLGKFIVRELMSRHMIMDMDHMSREAVSGMELLLHPQGFQYPLIAGHTGPETAVAAPNRNERQVSDLDLKYISDSHGLVGVGLNSGTASGMNQTTTKWGTMVNNDCSNSTKTWAQLYLYTVQAMGGPANAAVAVATDQGLNQWIGPRFPGGAGACPDGTAQEAAAQANTRGVTYPVPVFTAAGFSPVTSLPQAGEPDGNGGTTRVWDFNKDGMAHIGMYPDMIADLANIGMKTSDITPLFKSAEQYIRMWAAAEGINVPPPTIQVCPTGEHCCAGDSRRCTKCVATNSACPAPRKCTAGQHCCEQDDFENCTVCSVRACQ